MSFGGSLAGDASRGVDKVAGEDIDLKKLTKKTSTPEKAEEIIEGVTHDSIAEFADAKERRDANAGEPASGLLAKVRRFFNGG